jgi:DNA invertase Pin-like site-specific DNA recombinase
MTQAVIYARYSPKPDGQPGAETIATQTELCRAYCDKKGYEVAGIFTDELMSGADEDRPGLLAALDAIGRGMVLVAYRLDRLARNVYLSEAIRRQIERAGGRIETLELTADDTPEGDLIRRILQAFAEYERRVTANRTKHAMLRLQASGWKMGSKPPYGTAIDPVNPARLIAAPDELAVIAMVKQWLDEGASPETVKRNLRESGITTRAKKQFRLHQVFRLISRIQRQVTPKLP